MADRSIVVRLRAEVAQFKSAMGDASRSARGVGEQSERTSRRGASALSRMAQSARENEQAWSTVGRGLVVVGGAITTLGGALLSSGIQYNDLRQKATMALTAVTGSTEEAADQMRKLDEYGKNSWLMRDSLIRAQQTMTGFGIETSKVIPYMDALAEAVAAAGGNNQDFEELALVMGQVQSQGKITAEQLNQFGYRGVDAAQMIGNAMGLTAGEIRDKITAGSLDAEKALDALAEGMKTRYDGASDLIRNTFSGAVDDVKAAFRDLGAALAEPFVDPTGGGLAVTALNKLADALRAFQDMPNWLRGGIAILGALTGAVTLAGGAAMLAVPRMVEFYDSLGRFGTKGATAQRAIRGMPARLGKLALKAGIAAAAIQVLGRAGQKLEEAMYGTAVGVNELEVAMRKGDFDTGFQHLSGSYDSLGEALRTLTGSGLADQADRFFSGINQALGGALPDDVQAARDAFSSFDDVLVGLIGEGKLKDASAQFSDMAARAEELGFSQSDLLEVMPAFRDQLIGIADDSGMATDDATLLKIALGDLEPTMDKVGDVAAAGAEAFTGLMDSQREAKQANEELQAQVESSVQGLVDWTDGISDSKWTLSDWTQSLEDQAEALANFEDNLGTVHDRVADFAGEDAAAQVIDRLKEMGDEGMLAGDKLADASDEDFQRAIEAILGLDEQADSTAETLADLVAEHYGIDIDADTSDADAAIADFRDSLVNTFGTIPVDANTDPAGDAANLFFDFVDSQLTTTNVDADTDPAQGDVADWVWDTQHTTGTALMDANPDGADREVAGWVRDTRRTTGTAKLNANGSRANNTVGKWLRKTNRTTGTTRVNANRTPANNAVYNWRSWTNRLGATVTVNANTSPARAAARAAVAGISAMGAVLSVSRGFATGGPIHGAGTGTSDSIPAMLSNGEHVWTAREVAAAGGHGAIMAMRKQALAGIRGYATGGAVTRGAGPVLSAASMVSSPSVSVNSSAPHVAVYVQSPVDGSFVRSQAKVVVDGALAGVTRDMANTSTGGF